MVSSDVVANYKVPRLFFARIIGDIQRLQVGYATGYTVFNEKEKEKVWKGFVSRY